jgi:hypothetical protein
MIRATLPAKIFKAIALDPSNALNKLLVYASIVGLKVDASKDPCVLSGITDLELFSRDTALAIAQAGGDVENYAFCVKVGAADYKKATPAVLPRSVKPESDKEDAKDIQMSWEEWKDDSHEHYLIDGMYWVPGNSMGGVELLASEALALLGAQVEVVTMQELKAAMPVFKGE